MSTQKLQNHMLLQARRAGSGTAHPTPGVVTSYNKADYTAKVELQPSGQITGWLPVSSEWIGNGWGKYCPPSIGDAVNVYFQEVYFQEGDISAGWIEGRQFGGDNVPLAVDSGEYWLVHVSGSFIKLLNDGSIASKGVWNHDGPLNVTGDTSVTGNITATGDITDQTATTAESMRSQREIFDAHVHGGVEPGSGTSSTPTTSE
jgi:hypothetical protein